MALSRHQTGEADDSVDHSRRALLRFMVAAPVGAASAAALFGADLMLNDAVEKATHVPVGNAGFDEAIQAECGPNPTAECAQKAENKIASPFEIEVTGPMSEEFMFRYVPAAVSEVIASLQSGEKLSVSEIMTHLMTGTDESLLDRRELITGVLSTLAFAAVHNITDNGFNTHEIPLDQTMGGALFWVLQRKLGLPANIAAHITNNVLAVKLQK